MLTDFTLQEAVRLGIRVTARISLILFSIAFITSSLRFTLKNKFSFWMKNRRTVGLSFAFSHLIHGILFATLYTVDPELFYQVAKPTTIIFGGLGYVFILAMAMTSNNFSIQKLGIKRWRTLHTIGMYYLWFIFFASYAPRVAGNLYFLFLVVPMLAILVLKILVKTKRLAL
ncbi:hypothetical protein CIK05_08900 [Bdellovibrio sp. qaytius]|nr:hypothetical protein CIK05_08900 [Bdellovibrio sp. qaytius]